MRLLKLLQGEKGSIAVFAAIFMTVLVGMTALVLDVGQVYLERARIGNIADAAALAGAQEVFLDTAEAIQEAKEYALLNGADEEEIQIGVDSGNDTVTVNVERIVAFNFAKILGFDQITVSSKAVAQAQSVGKVKGIVPFGIPEQELDFGALYNLKVASPPTLGAGNFGALALGGNGASNYRDNIKYGFQQWVQVGDVLETENGNMSGPTMEGVNYRIFAEDHPPCTPQNFRLDCPRLVTVPIYRPLGGDNNVKQVEVVGFAAFLLEEVTGNGNESYIKGYFIQTVANGEASDIADDYGLRAVRLLE